MGLESKDMKAWAWIGLGAGVVVATIVVTRSYSDAVALNIMQQAKTEPSYHITGDELVSVIIPTYYEVDYIGNTLESIRHQTYTPIEIIVSDETHDIESIDATRQICDQYDATLVHRWIKNVALGRNNGADEATGDILLFIDADCILPNDYIEKMVRGLHIEGIHLSHGVDIYQPGGSALGQSGRFFWRQSKPNTYTKFGVAMYAQDFWLVGAYNGDIDPMLPHQREDKDLGRRVVEMWGAQSLYIDRTAIIAEAPRRPQSIPGAAPWKNRAWRSGKVID